MDELQRASIVYLLVADLPYLLLQLRPFGTLWCSSLEAILEPPGQRFQISHPSSPCCLPSFGFLAPLICAWN